MGRPKSRRQKRKEKAEAMKNQPLFFQGVDISTDEKMEEFTKVCIAIIASGENVKNVLKIEEKTLEYIYSLGYAFYQEGRYDKSLPLFYLLGILDHENPKYVFSLGAVHQMKGSYETAMEIYANAFLLNESDPAPLLRLAECAFKLDEPDTAEKALMKLLVIAGDQEKYDELKGRAAIILKEIKS